MFSDSVIGTISPLNNSVILRCIKFYSEIFTIIWCHIQCITTAVTVKKLKETIVNEKM